MRVSMVIVLYKGLSDVCEKYKNKPFDSSVKITIQVLQDSICSRGNVFWIRNSNTIIYQNH